MKRLFQIIFVFIFGIIIGFKMNFQNEFPLQSKFNTSSLESWCGEPLGTIKMISGCANGNFIGDENGKLWEVNPETVLDENALYLLWVDDMGTKNISDDELIKIWKEDY